MTELPESNLTKNLREQAEDLQNNIQTINELFEICSNSSLSEDELLKKAAPMIEKLGKNNPEVEKELKEVLLSGDSSKIKAFFDQEIQRRKSL